MHVRVRVYDIRIYSDYTGKRYYSEVGLINRLRIVNQGAQSLVLIQEAIPASCADYNLAALYFYTYILYI